MEPIVSIAPISSLAEAGSERSPVPGFTDPNLFDMLGGATALELDELLFGVVVLSLDGTVIAYNAFEAKLAGLTAGRVIGRNFFANVAPCTNNFMVAERFETEPDIDAIIDYVFTLRMTPKKVRLRLLKRTGFLQMYLIVERRV